MPPRGNPFFHASPSRVVMSWWSRLIGGRSAHELKPQRTDFLAEAQHLERAGDFDAALTSYRLALREKPDDHRVLQNMAIAYSKISRFDEAMRCYRRALAIEPRLSAAHYGLAYLLLKRGDLDEARHHLEAFLASPPPGEDSLRWVEHAEKTLAEIRAGETPGSVDGEAGS